MTLISKGSEKDCNFSDGDWRLVVRAHSDPPEQDEDQRGADRMHACRG